MRVLVIALIAALPTPAHAEEDRVGARAAAAEALVFFQAKDYQRALDGYWHAYNGKNAPSLMFNIAQCYRLLGKDQEALRAYLLYLALEPKIPDRAEVEKLVGTTTDRLIAAAAKEDEAHYPVELRQAPPTREEVTRGLLCTLLDPFFEVEHRIFRAYLDHFQPDFRREAPAVATHAPDPARDLLMKKRYEYDQKWHAQQLSDMIASPAQSLAVRVLACTSIKTRPAACAAIGIDRMREALSSIPTNPEYRQAPHRSPICQSGLEAAHLAPAASERARVVAACCPWSTKYDSSGKLCAF